LADLTEQLLEQIATGRLDEANRTVQSLISQSSNPSICNRATLTALREARTLALVERSHLQRRLRMVQASRLFQTPIDAGPATWQIDG
jgi:hypothetical protein